MLDLSPLERHGHAILSFSGGKDSTACLYLLRNHLDKIKVVHCDTGDLLPEVVDHVERIAEWVPNFVRIDTHVSDWIDANGLPSDLVPHTQHDIGLQMGEAGTRLVHRYTCCSASLMQPLMDYVLADGCSLLIRGTKLVDTVKLPVTSGESQLGVELWLPLLSWSHSDVFAYLKTQNVKLPRLYRYMQNAPECGRCSAWWGERRASYLKEHYPEIYADYRERMRAVFRELAWPMGHLSAELQALGGARALLEVADG